MLLNHLVCLTGPIMLQTACKNWKYSTGWVRDGWTLQRSDWCWNVGWCSQIWRELNTAGWEKVKVFVQVSSSSLSWSYYGHHWHDHFDCHGHHYLPTIIFIIMIKIAQPDQHKQTDKHIHIYIVNIVYIVICNILYLTMYTCISYDQQSTTWHEICQYWQPDEIKAWKLHFRAQLCVSLTSQYVVIPFSMQKLW